MKIKCNSDGELPLNKTIEIPNNNNNNNNGNNNNNSMIIVARAVFLKNNKYYPQVFLDECLYKL